MHSLVRLATLATSLTIATGLGCASMQRSEAENSERRLVNAGFERKVADSPEQEKHLAGLPQRKLVKMQFGEETRYVYADERFCKCIYSGGEEEFRAYSKLLRADIASAYLSSTLVVTPPDEAPVSDGVWGAWGP